MRWARIRSTQLISIDSQVGELLESLDNRGYLENAAGEIGCLRSIPAMGISRLPTTR